MQATVTGIAMWSRWQPERNLFFNSFFVEDAQGNAAIDPLPLDDADAAEIERRGGLAWVIVTNRDHLRDAASLASRFGAKIAASAVDAAEFGSAVVGRPLADGDTIVGARVIALEGLKTAGEFALHFRDRQTVIVGDALWGDPAGSLRPMADEKLRDPALATLSLRRLAAARPEHLLVGDGTCLFGNAWPAIWRALEARPHAYVNKVNLDELPLSLETAPLATRVQYHGVVWCDAGALIGAERLGYNYVRLEPGASFCPLHWHTAEEELFVMLSGNATLRTPRGELPLRPRDIAAFPTRQSGAHQITNTSAEPCELLLIANVDRADVCYYPDSQKFVVEATGTLVRDHPQLDYFDGE